MRISLFLLLITASLFSCSFTGKQIKKDKNIIYWSKEVKLTWDDFRGDVKNLPSKAVAISYIKIDYAPVFTGYADVRVSFDRKQSAKNSRLIDDDLLSHEQYHFNIGELFARKFRKTIQERAKEGDTNSVEIFNQMQKDFKDYQEL